MKTRREFLTVSQCKTDLDFKPYTAWSENLPAFAWGEQLLCGFESSGSIVDLQPFGRDITLVFCELHKNLSLAEISRLYKMQNLLNMSVLCQKNSLRFSESLTDLFEKLAETPVAFQKWTADRKLGAKELFILKSLDQDFSKFLAELADQNPTRQLGIQILENAGELHLLGHTNLSRGNETHENWCARLDQLRHPKLNAKISEQEAKLGALPWPKFISARVIQNQASILNEVKIQFRNAQDFKRNIEALEKVHGVLNAQ